MAFFPSKVSIVRTGNRQYSYSPTAMGREPLNMNARKFARNYKETYGKLRLGCRKTLKNIKALRIQSLEVICRLEGCQYRSEKIKRTGRTSREGSKLTLNRRESSSQQYLRSKLQHQLQVMFPANLLCLFLVCIRHK